MKKTLIALAVVAVSGTAFAQSTVTLSGKFGAGFDKEIGGKGGLSVSDGDVRFTAVEDLGGGLKANVSMEVAVRGRVSAAPNSYRNSTVGLSGGFGSVTIGAVEAGNGIMARGWAGAPISLRTGYDGAILSAPANVDWMMYQSPALIPGLTANVQRVDSIAAPGVGEGALQANVVGLNYAAGPISAGIDYTAFSNDSKRTRLSASYNFGVAMVGFGWEDRNTTEAQYTVGVSAPMGPVKVGAIYARNNETDAKGWAIGADYALSKRTAVNVSYGDVTSLDFGRQYRVRLMHSF